MLRFIRSGQNPFHFQVENKFWESRSLDFPEVQFLERSALADEFLRKVKNKVSGKVEQLDVVPVRKESA